MGGDEDRQRGEGGKLGGINRGGEWNKEQLKGLRGEEGRGGE